MGTDGRGWLVIAPIVIGLILGAIVQQIFGEEGTKHLVRFAIGAGTFAGAIVLWFCDRGRETPPNLTDTEQKPKEAIKDRRFWIPIRYWALGWIALAIYLFADAISYMPKP
jgi:hypothetical protein